MRETFRSLRHRNFKIFFATQGISFTGTWVQLTGQTLLIYDLSHNGLNLGLLAALQFLPTLVLGAWAGALIDRTDKRRLMYITSTAMLGFAAILSGLVFTHHATVGAVYVLAGLLGLANTFDNPARRVLVNDLVPNEDIVNAVSLNSTLVTVARIIGPAIAGLLDHNFGLGWCFALNAVSFVPVLWGLHRMDWSVMPERPATQKEKGAVRAGLRYSWSVDELRVPLIVMAVVGTLAFNYTTVMPVFADRVLHGDNGTFTLLMSVMGVGSMVASLAMARRETIDTRYVAWSAAVLAVSTVALAYSPNALLSCLTILVVGYSSIGVLSGGNAVLQLYASPEMRGRVLALFTVVFLGSTPIGGPIVGYVTQRTGAPAGLLVGAVAAGVSAAYALNFLRRRLPVDAEAAGLPALRTAP